jgi:hypothetical protein
MLNLPLLAFEPEQIVHAAAGEITNARKCPARADRVPLNETYRATKRKARTRLIPPWQWQLTSTSRIPLR